MSGISLSDAEPLADERQERVAERIAVDLQPFLREALDRANRRIGLIYRLLDPYAAGAIQARAEELPEIWAAGRSYDWAAGE